MKAHPLAKNYDLLTPEERFRLIMAASQRGDEAERDRLVQAGSRLTLTLVLLVLTLVFLAACGIRDGSCHCR